ncbi:MAG TPA: DNA polymerase III subunit delta' [Planctomycetaceae bacterium]|nr:DNA polymerase III subunit delta' [Planctomycetaceae bacterium]
MAWQGILGHDAIAERFRLAASRNRLAGSFLFIGENGTGKRVFAVALAKTLMCKQPDAARFLPCGICASCHMFPADPVAGCLPVAHPDFFYVAKPEEKATLPLELLVGDKEHRGKSGLCFEISRTSYLGGKKVAVIDDADFFNAETANALLKTLEEPPADSLLILLGSSATKQLPTIRSRCQTVRFHPLSDRNLATILHARGLVDSLEQGLRLAKRAGGSLDGAKDLMDERLEPSREELIRLLSVDKGDAAGIAARVNGFLDALAKDPPLRRRRLRFLFLAAIDYYRAELRKAETKANGERSDESFFTTRIECTLDAIEQIDRNANLPFIIDAWAGR